METTPQLKDKYFHGFGSLVANATGYSKKYVRDVLNGDHDDRDTPAVKKIKETADLLMTPVKEVEILSA